LPIVSAPFPGLQIVEQGLKPTTNLESAALPGKSHHIFPPLFPKSDLDRVPSTLAFQKHQAFPSSLGQAFIFGLILRSTKDFRLEPEAMFGPICPEMNKTWTQNHVLNIKLTCTCILNKDWRNLFLLVKSSLIVLKSNFPMEK